MLTMPRSLTFIMASVILVTCLTCPVMQAVDRWDHEIQTGQDTESALVVLALCIGAAFALARAAIHISKALLVRALGSLGSLFSAPLEMPYGINVAAFLSTSPPFVILRI